MNILQAILPILLILIENIAIIYLLNTKLGKKHNSSIILLACLLTLTLIMYMIGVMNFSEPLSSLIYISSIFVYSLLFCQSKLILKLFWSIMLIASLVAISLATQLFYMIVFCLSFEKFRALQSHFWVSVIINLIATLLEFSIFYIIAKKSQPIQKTSSPVLFVLCVVPIISIILMLSILGHPIPSDANRLFNHLSVNIVFAVIFINMFVFFIYDFLSKQSERILNAEITIQQNDMLQSHYNEMLTLQEQLKTWRHEYNNQMQVINRMLLSDQFEDLKSYASKLHVNNIDVNAFVCTEYAILDAIINTKLALCKRLDIKVDLTLNIPQKLSLDTPEITSLLGNLLDNAIEACERICDNTEKFICIDIQPAKQNLGVLICNSFDGTVKFKDEKFFTVKSSRNHGIGLKQIDSIICQYNGLVTRNYNGNVFETRLSIPLESLQ